MDFELLTFVQNYTDDQLDASQFIGIAWPPKEKLEQLSDALKSGKYKQCKGSLLTYLDGKFYHCVGGVCCDINGLKKGADKYNSTYYQMGTAKYYAICPTSIYETVLICSLI